MKGVNTLGLKLERLFALGKVVTCVDDRRIAHARARSKAAREETMCGVALGERGEGMTVRYAEGGDIVAGKRTRNWYRGRRG
jgi:hypothetical protein